jgi:integrase
MTGHIRRRGERSWELKFDAGVDPATGKRKTRYIAFRGTKAAAQRELVRLIAAEQSGQGIDPSNVTVSEFMEKWQRDWAQANTSARTFERYAELIRLHIVPRIGARKIQKLRPTDLAELYAALLNDGKGESGGLAPRTVGHVHRVLHRAFGHAALWSIVPANIVGVVSPPRVQQVEIEILKPAQLQTVRTALAGIWWRAAISTALGTGVRRGELLALRRVDLDLGRNERPRLSVNQSLEETKAHGLRFKEPKTKYGRRTIALPDYVAADLRAHLALQQEQRLALGLGRVPDDALIFPSDLMEPLSPRALSKRWEVFAAKLKIDVTFHALRHTHASQLIASGMDVLTISRRLGHSSPKVTLDIYGHLFANTDDRAAEIMDAAFLAGQKPNQ